MANLDKKRRVGSKSLPLAQALFKGMLGRVLGYVAFGLGFWLLFQGFLKPHALLAVLGGAMIPGGMYILARTRRRVPGPDSPDSPDSIEPAENKEDKPGDPLNGSG